MISATYAAAAASSCETDGIDTSSSARVARSGVIAGIILPVTVRQPDPTPGGDPERGFIVAVLAQGIDPDVELAELHELARTAGVEPIGQLVQHRPRPDQRTYVGKGKLDELKAS